MNTVPVEIILEMMSHMGGDQINKFCVSNKRIHNICRANVQTISKYALRNDYNFNVFPLNIDYQDILNYIRSNRYQRGDLIENSSKDDRFDIVEFLILNGEDDYYTALTTFISVEMFRFIYNQIRTRYGRNDVFNVIDLINKIFHRDVPEDDIGAFGWILFYSFVYTNIDLVDYLISNYSELINRDIIDEIQTFAIDKNFDVIEAYCDLMTTALENDDWSNLETFSNFYTNYSESEDENESIS